MNIVPRAVPECKFNLSNLNLKPGDKVTFKTAQIYTVMKVEVNSEGAKFMHWQAPCKTCGALFTCMSGGTTISGINRNCDTHKRRKKIKVKPLEENELLLRRKNESFGNYELRLRRKGLPSQLINELTAYSRFKTPNTDLNDIV